MSEASGNGKWKSFVFVILGGTLGVALLVFGGVFSEDKDGAPEQAHEDTAVYDDADAYAEMLEKRVAELCSGVKGAGKVQVLVSLKGGYRTVYAIDSQSGSTGYKSEIVMSGSGSDKRAVVTAYENPEIAGVGIICTGAASAEVREQMISLVAASLNVSTNKIFVAQAS